MKESITVPAVMTIAGSDSGGGAGVQVDLRTFAWFRTFGTSAVTALTFQNPLEVAGVEPVSPEAVAQQIRTVRREIELSAIKTGMLFSSQVIHAVTDAIADFKGVIVVDPVMVSTSGKRLLEENAVESMRSEFLSHASWITPNLPEASVLAGHPIRSDKEAAETAKEFAERWHCSVIIKGGHGSGELASDLICHEGKIWLLSAKRLSVAKNSDHGTGCTFSSAMTALFAKGLPWQTVLIRAKAFVSASLDQTVQLSAASGLRGMYPPASDLSVYEKQTQLKELC